MIQRQEAERPPLIGGRLETRSTVARELTAPIWRPVPMSSLPHRLAQGGDVLGEGMTELVVLLGVPGTPRGHNIRS